MLREYDRSGQETLCLTVTSDEIRRMIRAYAIENGIATEEEFDRPPGMIWCLAVDQVTVPLGQCKLIISRADDITVHHEMHQGE